MLFYNAGFVENAFFALLVVCSTDCLLVAKSSKSVD